MHLGAPDATLLAQLADRAGMMLSPKAFEAAGADFGLNPVCSGPYKFKSSGCSRTGSCWRRTPATTTPTTIHFDTVTFLPIPDTTVRLANLRSGDLDMLERLAATDLDSAKADPKLKVDQATSLGYQGITFNIANTDAAKNPLGENALVRQALSLCDRPRRAEPGGVQRRLRRRQPAVPADLALVRPGLSGARRAMSTRPRRC